MIKKHKKLSPEGKKITAGAASVLLGTGLMMSAHARPVKAVNSREDEISEVENANVLSTEKAGVTTRMMQKVSNEEKGANNISGQTTDDAEKVGEDNVPEDASTKGTDTETKQPTYDDAVEEVDKINGENDQTLQEAISKATDAGVKVEVSDEKEIPTTVGDIDKNKDELDKHTDEQINKINDQIKSIQEYWVEHSEEYEQYKKDKAMYDNAADEYIDKLIKLGLLKEEDREEAKKGELGQKLSFDVSNADIKHEILNSDIFELFNEKAVCGYKTNKNYINGEFLKVIYTGLNESNKYGDKQIKKIEVTYSDLVKGDWLYIYNANIYKDIVNFITKAQGITVSVKLYDVNGNLINLHGNTAYVNLCRYDESTNFQIDNGFIGNTVSPYPNYKKWINTINVSGDKIKIKFTSDQNFIDSWLSTNYMPEDLNFTAQKPYKSSVTITPGQLVLNEQAHVNIHYVDVNGVGGSEFSPDQGIELNDQLQSINHLAVGDRYVNDLWNWNDAGYVLATDDVDPAATGGIIKDKNGDVYIYLKHDTEQVTQKQEVNFVVYHQNANGATVAPDQVFTLSFNRNGIKDKVTPNLVSWSGTWTLTNPEVLSSLDNSVLKNLFGAGKIDWKSGAIMADAFQALISSSAFNAVMIHADDVVVNPDQGKVDQENTSASEVEENEHKDSEEENADSIDEDGESSEEMSTYPKQPEEVDDEESDVTPHAMDNSVNSSIAKASIHTAKESSLANNENVTKKTAITEESQITEGTQTNEATLPETGEDRDEFAKVMSGLAAALGITGLAATSRRRKKATAANKRNKKNGK